MDRLTVWDYAEDWAVPWGNGRDCPSICEENNSTCKDCILQKCLTRLAQYEDMEENGELIYTDYKIGQKFFVVSRSAPAIYLETCKGLEIRENGIVFILGENGDRYDPQVDDIYFDINKAESKLIERR